MTQLNAIYPVKQGESYDSPRRSVAQLDRHDSARSRQPNVGRGHTTPATRHGMTLLELMLVAAIMVVLAGLAVPSIQRTFTRQALQKGADRVRVAMGQARVKAIRHGEEYAVFISPGGAYFGVAPFTQFQQQAEQAAQRNQLAETRSQSNFEEDLLPQGVIFVGSEVGADARSLGVIASSQSSGKSVRPILFYPDGTSQDAKIVLQNEKQNLMEVQLRGLTGIAKTVRYNPNNQK